MFKQRTKIATSLLMAVLVLALSIGSVFAGAPERKTLYTSQSFNGYLAPGDTLCTGYNFGYGGVISGTTYASTPYLDKLPKISAWEQYTDVRLAHVRVLGSFSLPVNETTTFQYCITNPEDNNGDVWFYATATWY